MSAPKLLLPYDYVRAATRAINRANEHVALVSLIVANDRQTDQLIEALVHAARRGLRVEVAADTFAFGEFGGHFTPTKYYKEESRAMKAMVSRLKENGVKFTWVGRFSASPVSGRNHMKCLVADDVVFSFGGVNMYEESLEFNDYMFEVRDRQLALELRDDIARIIDADRKHFAYRSHEFSYGKDSKVLIDGGLQGDSIIYRRACQIIKEADSVIFASQYCPTSKISRLLKKTKSKLYFNSPQKTNTRINSALIAFNMLVSGNTSRYRRRRYLHAKFIIATMKDGSKVALTGSHNFTYIGVLFGTREIALETRDMKIIKQLEKFHKEHVV